MKIILITLLALFAFNCISQDSVRLDTSVEITAHDTTIVEEVREDTVPDISSSLIEDWFNDTLPVVLSFLITLISWFSKKIPFFKKISDTSLRVLAIAVTIGVAYYAGMKIFGEDASIWQIALSYFLSTVTYDVALKPISKAIEKKKAEDQ